MRFALALLMLIHGAIHLFGFMKAYRLAEFSQLTQPITKVQGILWLLGFVLFILAVGMTMVSSNYWWLPAFMGILLSQAIIFLFWKDAKFGTIANIIILIPAVIAFAQFQFSRMVSDERTTILEQSQRVSGEVVSAGSISHLPDPIQNWLHQSGTVGQSPISRVNLTQSLQVKLDPKQEEWYLGEAEQWFTTEPPAFIWNTEIEMNAFLNVVGRDKFQDGRGEMLIKMQALIPVADAKEDSKIDEATLQRYLAEIVWFPSAALSPYITWQPIGDFRARATMEVLGTSGSGVFHFDENGDFQKFSAKRYRDEERNEWTVIANRIEERNGYRIPVDCDASWELESGEWTWLKLEVKDIVFH
jgi:hypothetical protein